MSFQEKKLVEVMGDKTYHLPCFLLTEPDESGIVWIHLNEAPPIVSMACVQQVPMTSII